MACLKHVVLLLVFLTGAAAAELPDTDIVLFDVSRSDGEIRLSNPQTVANKSGYENQPYFSPDSRLIYFSRIEDGQSDIWLWEAGSDNINLTQSPWSEYSPTVVPRFQNLLSTVTVDENNIQRLWTYSPYAGFQILFPTIEPVGYHAWSGEQLALFVLGEPNELHVTEWGKDTSKAVDRNIGRCLQKVPGRHAVSYTKLAKGLHRLKIYDFGTSRISSGKQLPLGAQDYAWLDQHTLISWNGQSLVTGSAFKNDKWTAVEAPSKLKKVTRLALSPDGSKLAVVYEK